MFGDGVRVNVSGCLEKHEFRTDLMQPQASASAVEVGFNFHTAHVAEGITNQYWLVLMHANNGVWLRGIFATNTSHRWKVIESPIYGRGSPLLPLNLKSRQTFA